MFSEKFLHFIEIWQQDFAIERTMAEKVCEDKNGQPIPWYTYPAIEYLSQFDVSEKEIFEYGCGNSSAFWAKRAKHVTSIEGSPEWFEKWITRFKYDNLAMRLRDTCNGYAEAIFEDNKKYDIIAVDGKRRADCAKAAVAALNAGGMIILDDSDRVNTSQEYVDAINFLRMADLIQVDFYGFCPMNNYTKTTSLFLSRDFNFCSRHPVQPVNGIGNLWGMGRKKRKDFYRSNS